MKPTLLIQRSFSCDSMECLQSCSEIIEKTVKIGIVWVSPSNVKLFLETIYKDLRLKTSSKSRDHYHEDGNLVPSPRCGFSFEAAFQL